MSRCIGNRRGQIYGRAIHRLDLRRGRSRILSIARNHHHQDEKQRKGKQNYYGDNFERTSHHLKAFLNSQIRYFILVSLHSNNYLTKTSHMFFPIRLPGILLFII